MKKGAILSDHHRLFPDDTADYPLSIERHFDGKAHTMSMWLGVYGAGINRGQGR